MTLQATAAGLERYRDWRFGMFIHWGLYSLLGTQEWAMYTDKISVPVYEQLAPQFHAPKFNADEWVAIAADAGQKFITITSRHHDGFSMYDTALSDYRVTRTPFGRDPLAELAAACARRGDVKLGFYSSLLDWHHPAYRFRAESGLAWSDYIGFLHGQVRELCTQYGEVVEMWFDGDWPHHLINDENRHFLAGGSFEYDKLYAMIHTLQPHCIIHNNRHEEPLPGEDVQGFEQDLPGENSTGFNATTIYGLPIEVCMTINDHWGFSKEDRNTKSVRRLVHVLARSASVNGTLLLNVGPSPEGEILPQHAERLRGVGEWLAANGESIYRTRAGVIPPTRVSVSTRRGDTHYVHLLDNESDCLNLTGVPATVTGARLLATGEPLEMRRVGNNFFVSLESDRVEIYVPPEKRDSCDTVVVLA